MAELETLVCECGCALEIAGWPDWVDDAAEVVSLRRERRDLRHAA